MCSTQFNDRTVKCQSLLQPHLPNTRAVCPILLQMRSNIRLWNVQKDLSQISLLFRMPGNFPFMVACCWVLFFLFKTEHLLAVQWRRGPKYSKKTMRLWLREKLKSSVVLKGKWFKHTLFFLFKLPQLYRKHLFSLPLSEMWSILQFILNLERV